MKTMQGPAPTELERLTHQLRGLEHTIRMIAEDHAIPQEMFYQTDDEGEGREFCGYPEMVRRIACHLAARKSN